MKGKAVTDAIKKKLRIKTDKGLATQLDITTQAVQNWKKRKSVTERQIAGLIHSRGRAVAKTVESAAIKTIVEFFPIEKCESSRGATYELFATDDDHPYRLGVKKELSAQCGIYIFFDSRGQAIYAGKAQRQTLWKELNLAFNRDRGEVQKIKRVSHPTRRVEYRRSEEKDRQIVDHVVPLHDLAAYFSAYAVTDGLIGKLEAMLVRSFANDLLNVRMEKFSQARCKKTKSERKGHKGKR